MDPTANISDLLGARQREMEARHLLTHLDEVTELIASKQWERLIAFADAVAADAPLDLASTDPALFRTLRKAVTEVHVRGLALDPQELRRLAAASKPSDS